MVVNRPFPLFKDKPLCDHFRKRGMLICGVEDVEDVDLPSPSAMTSRNAA